MKKTQKREQCQNIHEMPDVSLSKDEIIEAIGTLSYNSAAGPDGVPAVLLKNCKESIAAPLVIIWSNCLKKNVLLHH